MGFETRTGGFEMKVAHIYALGDPRDGSIFYVGQTVNPSDRYKQHLSQIEGTAAKIRRTMDIMQSGLRPCFVRLETVPFPERLTREREYIQWFLKCGHRLTNEKKPSR